MLSFAKILSIPYSGSYLLTQLFSKFFNLITQVMMNTNFMKITPHLTITAQYEFFKEELQLLLGHFSQFL